MSSPVNFENRDHRLYALALEGQVDVRAFDLKQAALIKAEIDQRIHTLGKKLSEVAQSRQITIDRFDPEHELVKNTIAIDDQNMRRISDEIAVFTSYSEALSDRISVLDARENVQSEIQELKELVQIQSIRIEELGRLFAERLPR